MPSRNIYKIDTGNSYYHVYARGQSRSKIFLDDQDHAKFLSLFARYLSDKPQRDSIGLSYPHLQIKVELLCFCMMKNHFHLLLYQQETGAMTALMRGVMTSYSRYFNKKYQRTGPLFESRYKASTIYTPNYLEHISRYIHLNRKLWRNSPYTSIGYYNGIKSAEWINPKRILDLFSNVAEYINFVGDYEDNQRMLDELKHELANDITP